tara:strand:- start:424 stop:975 length:552 start_codon:yes stop_codon:yes gene_type:complete
LKLVEITELKFNVCIELKYATNDNFTNKPIYKSHKCYLNAEAAKLLTIAVKIASILNLKIKIYDAFRPKEAQKILWDHTPDPNFLTNPDIGSPHSRGAAIDVTLLDQENIPLEMGTDFDFFSPLSHHNNQSIGKVAFKNRLILLGIMTQAGFDHYKNEWWHYQLYNSKKYDVLDDKKAQTKMM